MAGTPPPVEEGPKLGLKATLAGLVFALTILAGFGVATAASYNGDAGYGDHSEEGYDDDGYGDDDHADDGYEDDDHADE